MDQEPETLQRRIRFPQKPLREQVNEIREVTARNRWAAVNTATLDLRVTARVTRAEIDMLVALSSKGTMDSCDSDSSTGGPTARETLIPRHP